MNYLGRLVAACTEFRLQAVFLLAWCVSGRAAEVPPGIDPVQAGQDLARELRSAVPAENAEFTGTMIIIKPGSTNKVPIQCKIDMKDSGWTVTYETKPAGNQQQANRNK